MAENNDIAWAFEIQDNVLTRFKGTFEIESITIPDGVTAIDDTFFNSIVFSNVYRCKNVVVPASVTRIGRINGAKALENIIVDESNKFYSSVNGVLFSKDKSVLAQYPPGRKGAYSIPYGVKSIEDRAFLDAQGLTDITIPSSVTSIGDLAFRLCVFTSVTIPSSVTSIGGEAFSWNDYLTSVTIEEGVTSIGVGAFNLCKRLTSVTIPKSVKSIGRLAFGLCENLTSITIPSSVTSIGGGAFIECVRLANITFNAGDTLVQSGTEDVTFPCESVLRKVSGSPAQGDYKPKRGTYIYAQGGWTSASNTLLSYAISAVTFIIIGVCLMLPQIIHSIGDGPDPGFGVTALLLVGAGCVIGGICCNPAIGGGVGAFLGGIGFGVGMGIWGGGVFSIIFAAIISAVCVGVSGGVFGAIAAVFTGAGGTKRAVIVKLVLLALVVAGGLYFLGDDIAIAAKYLSGKKNAAESPVATAPVVTAAVTANAANFREGPGTGHKVLRTLKKGDILTVIEEAADGWLHVEHEGKRGYMSKDLLSVQEGQ
jgi:hypothetical protein